MIREIIRPQEGSFTINIPSSYINRDVEFIMFPLDEKETIQDTKKSEKKSLRGVFSRYADSEKISLEDGAWNNHILEKYK
jgi:hypothetical protein